MHWPEGRTYRGFRLAKILLQQQKSRIHQGVEDLVTQASEGRPKALSVLRAPATY